MTAHVAAASGLDAILRLGTQGRALLDGALSASGDQGPGAPLPPADALPFLLLLAIVVFAIIGYLRGFGKEWLSALVVTVGYWLLDRHWAWMAASTNRFAKLFTFTVVRRGVLAEDPGAVWSEVGEQSGWIRPDGQVLLWQIAFFTGLVLTAYVVSSMIGRDPSSRALRIWAPRNLLARSLGAIVGGWSGFLIGWFYLQRLLPAHVPESGRLAVVAHGVLGRIGPMMLLGAVIVLMVFGVLSLGGRRKRVYT